MQVRIFSRGDGWNPVHLFQTRIQIVGLWTLYDLLVWIVRNQKRIAVFLAGVLLSHTCRLLFLFVRPLQFGKFVFFCASLDWFGYIVVVLVCFEIVVFQLIALYILQIPWQSKTVTRTVVGWTMLLSEIIEFHYHDFVFFWGHSHACHSCSYGSFGNKRIAVFPV